jgi:hypothetical protein
MAYLSHVLYWMAQELLLPVWGEGPRHPCRDLFTIITKFRVPRDFPFLLRLERKTSIGVGREERRVFAFQIREQKVANFVSAGLSKLCSNSSLRPLRARDLLAATVCWLSSFGYVVTRAFV